MTPKTVQRRREVPIAYTFGMDRYEANRAQLKHGKPMAGRYFTGKLKKLF